MAVLFYNEVANWRSLAQEIKKIWKHPAWLQKEKEMNMLEVQSFL